MAGNPTQQRVKKILAEHLDVPIKEVTLDRRLEDLNTDPLDVIELPFLFNEAFSTEISEDAIEKSLQGTVRDLVECVRKAHAPAKLAV